MANAASGGVTESGLSSGGGFNMLSGATPINLTVTPGTSAQQMISMLGNSFSTVGGPSFQHQAGNDHLSSIILINKLNAHENSTFDMNDFPQLAGRPTSVGDSHGQQGLLGKQSLGFIHQNQEFIIQNEDFPALPGYKGGITEFPVYVHQKERLHNTFVSIMQSQHLPMGRSSEFSFGGAYWKHQLQHGPLVNGVGISVLPSYDRDLHTRGSEDLL